MKKIKIYVRWIEKSLIFIFCFYGNIELLSCFFFDFLATSIYTVGIGLSTPNTNPPFIKYIALGGLLAIQFFFLLFFSLKKIKERADERFYANLAKAATLMFAICIATLLVRAGLRDFLRKHGKDGRVLIPEDGECLEFLGT